MRALAIAGLLVLAGNALLSARLPALLRDTSSGTFVSLEHQIEAYPHKDRVRLLVLGNSHAQAGLRIPILAAELGVPVEACFSLALPYHSAEELELLVPRLLPHFPAVRLAVCGVDPVFLGRQDESRMRFLTRHRIEDRWAFAMRQADPEDRLSLLVGWGLPLVDLGGPLRDAFAESPMRTARRLVEDLPPATPEPTRLAARPYPWGVPPNWDYFTAAQLATLKNTHRARSVQNLAPWLVGERRARERGFAAFQRVLTRLEAARVTPVLVEMPFERRMLGVLGRRPHAAQYQDYRQRLDRWQVLKPAPDGWDRNWYVDQHHLTVEGAERLSRWLAPHLRGRLAGRE